MLYTGIVKIKKEESLWQTIVVNAAAASTLTPTKEAVTNGIVPGIAAMRIRISSANADISKVRAAAAPAS